VGSGVLRDFLTIVFFLKYLEMLHLLLDLEVSKSTKGFVQEEGLGVPAVMSCGILFLGKNQIFRDVDSIWVA
jgi:hypothetical protein